MKLNAYALITVVGAVVGVVAGVMLRDHHDSREVAAAESPAAVEIVDRLPTFNYPDLSGRTRSADEFRDQVMVVNFWATWCPPCRKETPEFIALQSAYDDRVRFVGIAIDDPEPVRNFVSEYGVNYPILLGDVDAMNLTRRLGNRYEGLPFTVVVRPGGEIVMRHAGELQRQELDQLIQRLLAES